MSVAKKNKDVGEHNYKVGDIVLAKIRGYPPWPAMIVDPDNVPPAVAKERQSSKKTKFYCTRFFPVGDYAWLVAKDLSLLQKHEIEAYINEPHKKSGDLLLGYKIALDPAEWEANHAEAAEYGETNEEALEELEQYDQLDEDMDEPKKKSRKRKRESEVKPKKKKDSTTGDKKGSAGAESKDKKAAGRKRSAAGKKNGIRSQEAVESEDDNVGEAEGAGVAAGSSKKGAPLVKKPRKDKGGAEDEFAHLASDADAVRVRDWRHKLQRAFLSKLPVQLEDMPEHDQLFRTIENHELTIEQLQYSKLGKVMRHISSMDPSAIPNEEQYQIRNRAQMLLEKWQVMIGEATSGGINGAASTTKKEESDKKVGVQEEKPAVNGEAAVQNLTAEHKLSTDVQVDTAAEEQGGVKVDTSA